MLRVVYHGGQLSLEWSQVLRVGLDHISPWWVRWLGLAERWQLTVVTPDGPLVWRLRYVPGLVHYHRVLRGKEVARHGKPCDVVLV